MQTASMNVRSSSSVSVGRVCVARRPFTSSLGARPARLQRVATMASLVLVPTGDGSSGHLSETVSAPGRVALKDGSFTLGGDSAADYFLPVPTVSSKHAQIDVGAEGVKVTVTDLGSTNGTAVDGKDLQPKVPRDLPLGAQISFGDTHLAQFVVEEEETSPSEA